MGLWNEYDTEAMDGLLSAVEGYMHQSYDKWSDALETKRSVDNLTNHFSDDLSSLYNSMYNTLGAYDPASFSLRKDALLRDIVRYMANAALLYLKMQHQHECLPFNKAPEPMSYAGSGWITGSVGNNTATFSAPVGWENMEEMPIAIEPTGRDVRPAHTPTPQAAHMVSDAYNLQMQAQAAPLYRTATYRTPTEARESLLTRFFGRTHPTDEAPTTEEEVTEELPNGNGG